MCLIIHKPQGVAIPDDLLRAAAVHNTDGWGLMGFEPNGRSFVHKGGTVSVDALLDLERKYRAAEYALHLRRQTRGGSSEENTHPFRVLDGVFLMHNGTLNLPMRVPGRSDTWHFVHDVLRPLATRHPGLLSDHGFVRVLEFGLRAENKLVLLDRRLRRLTVINRCHGVELETLWLSSTRWIDRRRFPLVAPPKPQALSYALPDVGFAS